MPEAKTAQNFQIIPLPAETSEPHLLNHEALSVSQITLSNFRSYKNTRLHVQAAPVVLTGPNGSGKTNLLEAISLMVPGRGLRRSPLADLQNRAASEPWAISIELRTEAGPLRIGTGKDNAINDSEGERRLVYIDGKPVRSQTMLADHIAMAWITPDMDRLLAEGASLRRKFLDRLAYSFDPAHGMRVLTYEKAMRERLRLLREGTLDAAWLAALENEMAQSATAIAATRKHLVRRLRTGISEGGDAFPKAKIEVRGTAEDMLETIPALPVEDALRCAFAASRDQDAQHGNCSTGAHRSDLRVVHAAKDCPAELCSTGEQKALMIALMLAYVRLLSDQRHMIPLFLLDDIAAHLDTFRREALFDEVLSIGAQAWFTGTSAKMFSSIAHQAQFCDTCSALIQL
ncbi:MAG: DNA replication/repair protein RecF [Alphaproteobacteria bacterium]|nr:DNA replication/repair protein RecF [Alphaproteobacteria bacterium]